MNTSTISSIIAVAISLTLNGCDIAPERAAGSKPVQPFGGLTWDDNVSDVVSRLSGQALQTIQILSDVHGIDTMAPVNVPKASPAQIAQVLERGFPRGPTESFVDSAGRTFAMNEVYGIVVEAYPIMIEGLPFKLTAVFRPSFGYGLKHPEKLFAISGRSRDEPPKILMSHVLTRVSLETKVFEIRQTAPRIIKLVQDKYPANDRNKTAYSDANGNTVKIYGSPEIEQRLEIEYDTTNGNLVIYDQEYKKHLSSRESGKFQNQPDRKSDL